MIKIWFLIALMSYPNMSAIAYRGFGGFLEQEECEDKRVIAENIIADFEMRKGTTAYIKTFLFGNGSIFHFTERTKKVRGDGSWTTITRR